MVRNTISRASWHRRIPRPPLEVLLFVGNYRLWSQLLILSTWNFRILSQLLPNFLQYNLLKRLNPTIHKPGASKFFEHLCNLVYRCSLHHTQNKKLVFRIGILGSGVLWLGNTNILEKKLLCRSDFRMFSSPHLQPLNRPRISHV